MARRSVTVVVLFLVVSSSGGCLGTGLVYYLDNALPPPFDTIASGPSTFSPSVHSGMCFTVAALEGVGAIAAAADGSGGAATALGVLAFGDLLAGASYRTQAEPRHSVVVGPNGAVLTYRF
ncbi:MAG: hypothetical protein ACYTKD_13755 [Planctomycetota bacterium]|jgi:hypothetical protein